jgi:hypothetical protein
VVEDLPDDRRTLDDGDDFHPPATLGTIAHTPATSPARPRHLGSTRSPCTAR